MGAKVGLRPGPLGFFLACDVACCDERPRPSSLLLFGGKAMMMMTGPPRLDDVAASACGFWVWHFDDDDDVKGAKEICAPFVFVFVSRRAVGRPLFRAGRPPLLSLSLFPPALFRGVRGLSAKPPRPPWIHMFTIAYLLPYGLVFWQSNTVCPPPFRPPLLV